MVKNVFQNLSKGFFYTIGKVIAILFIALVVYTLITKLSDKLPKSDYNQFYYKPYLLGVKE